MTEYPEALVVRVGSALNDELDICTAAYDADFEPCYKHRRTLDALATAALDAIGLTAEPSAFPERFAKHYRYVTPWENRD